MSQSIRELQARRIDGLLVIGDGHEHVSPSLTHNFEVPVTYVFTASSDENDVMYLPDNRLAGRMAAEHLIGVGATRIAHITGPRSSIAAQRRKEGMRDTLQDAGLEQVGPTIYGDWTRQRGTDSLTELLESGAKFDGIFCGNDHIALAAVEACTAAGIRVPDDVALVGVDNWEGTVVDQNGLRQLTSVDLELMELGRLGAANLLTAERIPGEHYSAPTLVLGPSSRR
jgi:LacI family transcriptional regulator